MEPRNYVGDNFSRVTPIYKVTLYNIACCYSMLNQVGGGRGLLEGGGGAVCVCILAENGTMKDEVQEQPEVLLVAACWNDATNGQLDDHGCLLALPPPPPSPPPPTLLLQVDEGLRSLDLAMAAGFEDYAKVRSDKNLAAVRASPKFEKLINAYDEPVINWGAVQGTFGFLGKVFKKE
jgi:hypothetical protein